MVLIGLLVAAVVSLVLGLALASTVWLVVSLVASLAAGITLYTVVRTQRAGKIDEPVAPVPARSPAAATAEATAGARKSAPALVPAAASPALQTQAREEPVPTPELSTGANRPSGVWVVDGRPAYHLESCDTIADSPAEVIPLAQAVADGFTPCPHCAPPQSDAGPSRPSGLQVWVADGYPEYHLPDCADLAGLTAEPIPHEQALEDGFQPCVVCNPDAVFAGGFAAPHGATQVWVADGFPDYHLPGCRVLADLPGEPIPFEQAIEDGFTPCAACRPTAPGGRAGASAADVWVVDGRPAYHRRDCADIVGVGPEAIPHRQAVEDGFVPCPHCTPDDAHPARAGAAAVWVVDGHPDYHRPDCRSLAGLDPEPITHDQATEDGFTPCPACDPDGARAAAVLAVPEVVAEPEPVAEPAVAVEPAVAAEPEVATSPETAAEPAEAETAPEPVAEPEPIAEPVAAPESMAEPVAEPEAAAEPIAATAAPGVAASGESKQVWVRNGRPRYHTEDCLIIKGQEVTAISLDQAVADGFQPCSLCARP